MVDIRQSIMKQFFDMEQVSAGSAHHNSQRSKVLETKAQSCIKKNEVRALIRAGFGGADLTWADNNEKGQLASHLLQLKSSCSGVKLQIREKEAEQLRLREESGFMGERARGIAEERERLEGQIDRLRSVIEEARNRKLTASLSSKSYEHILDRMRRDDIKAQIRKNHLEQQQQRLLKTIRELTQRGFEAKEYEQLSHSGLREAREEVGELSSQRHQALAQLNSTLQQRAVLQQKKQARKEKSDNIKEMAAGDLEDADLIRLKKFLGVQVFVKALLRSRMEKVKALYEPFEMAFLTIKSHTSIRDPAALKQQHQTFEHTYNEKVAWISHLQNELQTAQGTTRQLRQQLRQLKEQELELMEEAEASTQVPPTAPQWDLQKRAHSAEMVMTAVREWLEQQGSRVGAEVAGLDSAGQLGALCERLRRQRAE